MIVFVKQERYTMEMLEEKIKKLPPYLQNEVSDFVDFLSTKYHPTKNKKLTFKWAGKLSEYKNRFTSVELQKKALEWR